MRHPIQRQLLWPMLAVVLLGSAATALLAAWLGMQSVRQAEHERLQQLAGTLTDSGFPLTEGVLKRMSELSGAVFVTLDDSGRIQHSSQAWTESDQQQLSELPMNSSSIASFRDNPIELSTGEFRAVRIPVRMSARTQPLSLVILTPQERWDDLAWKGMLPPLIAGLLSCTIAAALAVILSRQFVQRIHSLSDRAAELAEGCFERHPLPLIDDEMRDLAVAMNVAAEKLTHYESQVRRGERLQTLGRLGAGMAHQLRNAITGARMALDLHAGELPTTADRESLSVALRQMSLMESYLLRFLTLGRGHMPQKIDFDFSQFMTEALQLIEPICRHHTISVTWQPPSSPVLIHGDAEGLRQMVLNLLMNAIEAVQSQPVTQRQIGVELHDQQGIQICIWDSGPGPSAEMSPKLFEPFASDKPDGTGLGLAVAMEIAKSHDGTIRWSRSAERTCFTVEIPGS